jgi:hypothetical protein
VAGKGFKTGLIERVGHFHMRVDTLLAQDGNPGTAGKNGGRRKRS